MTQQSPRARWIQGSVITGTIIGYLYFLIWLFDIYLELPYNVLALLTASISYLAFNRVDLTQRWRFFRSGSVGNRVVLHWMLISSLLLLIGLVSQYSAFFSRRLVGVWFATTPLVLAAMHFLVRYPLKALFPELGVRRKAVICFVNDSSRQLAELLKESDAFEPVGFFEDRELDRLGGGFEGLPYLGKATDIVPYVKANAVRVVFIVLPGEGTRRAIQVIEELNDTTASVYYVPDFMIFNLLKTTISEIEGMPAIEIAETPFYGADGVLKRAFDMVFSVFAMVALTPVFLVIGAAVKINSRGPVFFKQKRYGLDGEAYSVYKFRSMYVGDDAARQVQQATKDDPRVTSVGRFIRRTSLDELPQFFNVLRGDMSVVGPRPHSVAHNEHYRKEVRRYMVRHKVKPGVTGWAQVNGLRGETETTDVMAARIRYDLEYIRNWSPVFDLKIILLTVAMMVAGDKKAY